MNTKKIKVFKKAIEILFDDVPEVHKKRWHKSRLRIIKQLYKDYSEKDRKNMLSVMKDLVDGKMTKQEFIEMTKQQEVALKVDNDV